MIAEMGKDMMTESFGRIITNGSRRVRPNLKMSAIDRMIAGGRKMMKTRSSGKLLRGSLGRGSP
jgi:hypothetical protein